MDGYNIIFAWDDLNELAKYNIESARGKLMDILSNYQGYKKMTLILVFDAYKVKGNQGEVGMYHNIHVVYTKEAETADHYIAQRHGNAHLEQRADGVIAPGNQRKEHGDKQRPTGQQHYAGKKHCPRKHRTGLQADHQIQYQQDANRQVPHPQRGCLLEVLLKRMEKRGNELAFLPAGHL